MEKDFYPLIGKMFAEVCKCVEAGECGWVCPYRRHLVKLFAQAKVFVFEGGHGVW